MTTWEPISESEFRQVFETQYAELDPTGRARFDRFRVPLRRATIKRSEAAGDERVFVVAENEEGVLYFDDVENGFNISEVDEQGRIVRPGGSQATLREAVEWWFPE